LNIKLPDNPLIGFYPSIKIAYIVVNWYDAYKLKNICQLRRSGNPAQLSTLGGHEGIVQAVDDRRKARVYSRLLKL
jgi:hypothetical protein